MLIGSVLFAQPLVLLGLIALPIIYWLLRATPPAPKQVALPSLSLLDGLDPFEETPVQTPWWILALRFAIAALAIIGFAQPVIQNSPTETSKTGSTLIIVDDGWASANQWKEIKKTILSAADTVIDSGSVLHLLNTAPNEIKSDIDQVLGIQDIQKKLQISSPSAWAPDHAVALEQIQKATFNPTNIIWISDGLEYSGTNQLREYLSGIPDLTVYSFAPKSTYAITDAITSPKGANVFLKRIANDTVLETRIIAESSEGGSLASAVANFAHDSSEAIADFAIPSAILNQVARFRVLGSSSAGQVWLWDDASLMPSVALADPTKSDQPLLEEYYYIRKALTPYAQLMEGNLDEMISRSPDAIILGDRTLTENDVTDALQNWINDGGVLIRFAGPKLAASDRHFLVPSALRPATRALGGALGWEKPQPIAPFVTDKAFSGIKTPADNILVKQQVLAQPSADLANITWAHLVDGTPLVTAAPLGRGMLVLFHVTATPDWSDLPYDGSFIEMLRRAAASGKGKRATNSETTGSLAPFRILDAYGTLNPPSGNIAPIASDVFNDLIPALETPPGVYVGPQGSRSLNAGRFSPEAITDWPDNATVLEDGMNNAKQGLEGLFLMAAFGLLILDLIVALFVSGRFRQLRKSAFVALIIVFGVNTHFHERAYAQSTTPAQTNSKVRDAALHMRFAYVETQNTSLNFQLDAGLKGLNAELKKRTSVEPSDPHPVKLGVDQLDLYPMIYFVPDRDKGALNPQEINALNNYLRNGGSLVIDTRDAIPGQSISNSLKEILQGLDVPPLLPTPQNHVLTRSFYLLNEFPGRIPASQVWIEANTSSPDSTGSADRVSRIFIGASDWIGAWAIDERSRPLNSMDGQETRREHAYRFGINLVMCILTGTYKEDQVHIPALLQRLEQENNFEPNSGDNREQTIIPAPEAGSPQNLDDFFDAMRRQRDAEEAEGAQ